MMMALPCKQPRPEVGDASMMRTYRYPLSPTVVQATVLEQWRVACQQLYNGALQERRDAWQRAKVSIGYNDQTKSLTELRKEDEWKAIPSIVSRSALSRIDKSFKAIGALTMPTPTRTVVP